MGAVDPLCYTSASGVCRTNSVKAKNRMFLFILSLLEFLCVHLPAWCRIVNKYFEQLRHHF